MHHRYHIRILALLLTLFTLPSLPAAAQELITRDVVTGLDTPWEILWGPDDHIWMTERNGRISRVNPTSGAITRIDSLTDVIEDGESGLLGMALHPNFADSAHVFVAYTYRSGQELRLKIVRFTYNGSDLTSPTTLLQNVLAASIHDGCRLLITPDRKLLATIGDAGNGNLAQDYTSINGKIIRMNLDGSVPADNPHPNDPFPARLFWTLGHRNPQGLVLAPSGILYSSEHGPGSDDEVNIIKKGRNYGWPRVQGPCSDVAEQLFCTDSNVVEPARFYTPTIAPAGLDYYNHGSIPEWRHSLLMATLNSNGSDLRQLKLSEDGQRITSEKIYFDTGGYGRIRDICISPLGRVYIATSNRDGRGTPGANDDRIVEIRSTYVPPVINAPIPSDTTVDLGDPIAVTFTVNGTFDPGNLFQAELSDANGSFGLPIPIAVATPRLGGTIDARIPCGIPGGSGYRIRIVSSAPIVTSPDNGFNITVRPRTVADLTITPSDSVMVCGGDSVTLRATDGFSRYTWNTGATTQNITVKATGTYFVIAAFANDCLDRSDTALVVVRPKLAPKITPNRSTDLCEGDSVMLDAGFGYTSYLWSDGSTGQRLVVKQAGAYTVSVTDVNGCSAMTEPTTVTVRPSPQPTAMVSGMNLSAEAGFASYQWNFNGQPINGATERTFTATDPGMYSVTVTNDEGCRRTSPMVAVGAVSVPGMADAGDLEIYPQPARDRVTLALTSERSERITIVVTDIGGTRVRTLDGTATSGRYTRDISLEGLPAGAYFIEATIGDRIWKRKIVKE